MHYGGFTWDFQLNSTFSKSFSTRGLSRRLLAGFYINSNPVTAEIKLPLLCNAPMVLQECALFWDLGHRGICVEAIRRFPNFPSSSYFVALDFSGMVPSLFSVETALAQFHGAFLL